MQRVIHFSGGKTSALMTLLLQPTADDVVLFTDTCREHPATYQFIDDFERHEGIKIHRATYTHHKAPGLKGFDALIEYKKYLPNRVKRICTVELKIKTARRYLRELGLQRYESYIGFRADEERRVLAKKGGWKKVVEKYPLYELGIIKKDVEDFWASMAYTLTIPSILGNCDLCFLKGKNALMRIMAAHPEMAERWIADEQKIPVRGDYETPAVYIKGTRYEQLLAMAGQQQSLYPLESLAPAYDCSCTT